MLANRKAGRQVQVAVLPKRMGMGGWFRVGQGTFTSFAVCAGHLHFAFGIWHGTESHGYVSITKQLETTTRTTLS